jgi:quinol monooxygenase YgiN
VTGLIIRTQIQVNDGAMEQFLKEADRWVDSTVAEPGTVGYHVFVNRDTGQAIFLEHYTDDAAFLAHSRAITPGARAALYAAASLAGFEVYGDPGPEVRGVLKVPAFGHYRSK